MTAASNRWFGTKTTLLVGSVLVAVGWLTASFATEVWHLFVTVGACFGWVSLALLFDVAAFLRAHTCRDLL